MTQLINEAKRFQKLAGILEEAEMQGIDPSDIEVDARFKFKNPKSGELTQIIISQIETTPEGESVYFKYTDRGNQGQYLLGDRKKVADYLNNNYGEKLK